MTEDYLTDDEQLENIKRAALENGPAVIGGVAVALTLVFGWRFYHNHQDERALAASAEFGAMAAALGQNDRAKTRQLAAGLIREFPGSPYADQARLMLARLAVDEGQDANAIASLTDVMNGSKDAELKHIARLRLARVLIDQGKPDQAIDTLNDPPGAFAARYHEVRGDAFFAKQDHARALTEYEAAQGAGAASGMDSALLALKIADLGAPPVPLPVSISPGNRAPASSPGAPAPPSNKGNP